MENRVLGQRIKLYRELNNFSKELLAESAGISLSHLVQIERGARGASIDSLSKIAKALNISMVKLLTDELPEDDPFISELMLLFKDTTPSEKQSALNILKVVIEEFKSK